MVPTWGPQSSDVKKTPWICQLLCSGIIERDRSSCGKIIDDGIIEHIMISITPVIAITQLVNLCN